MSIDQGVTDLGSRSDNLSSDTESFVSTVISNIKERGNQSLDWLEFTDALSKNIVSNEGFYRAINVYYVAIKEAEDVTSEAYAQLYINYAQLWGTKSEDQARCNFSSARLRAQKFAIVHIAAAQFEHTLGNANKAVKILRKARDLQVVPMDLLDIAERNLTTRKKLLITNDDKVIFSKITNAGGSVPTLNYSSMIPPLSNTNIHSAATPQIAPKPVVSLSNQLETPIKSMTCDSPDGSVFVRKTQCVLSSVKKVSALQASNSRHISMAKLVPQSHNLYQTPEPGAGKNSTTSDKENSYQLGALPAETGETSKKSSAVLADMIAKRRASRSHKTTRTYGRVPKISIDDGADRSTVSLASSDNDSPYQMHLSPEEVRSGMSTLSSTNPFVIDINSDDLVHETSPASNGDMMSNYQSDDIHDSRKQNLIDPPNFDIYDQFNHPRLSQIPDAESNVVSKDNLLDSEQSKTDTRRCPHPVNDVDSNPSKSSHEHSVDTRDLSNIAESLTFPRQIAPNKVQFMYDGESYTYELSEIVKRMKSNDEVVCPEVDITMSSKDKTLLINNHRYTILRKIGTGGFSVVYDAVAEDFGRELRAVKCLQLNSADKSTIDGYKKEIKLLEKFKNCLWVIHMHEYEYNSSKQQLYIVMERGDVDLGVLFNNMKQNQELMKSMVVYYWRCMLHAVNALHQHGVIHSDLKPANFVLVAGQLKLIDFGIARSIQPDRTSVTNAEEVAGTMNYMSPETLQNQKIGTRSDVWSLGCILYSLVYGRAPFNKLNMYAKITAITSPNHVIPYPETADRLAVDVLQKCLVREPHKRACIEDLLQHPFMAQSTCDTFDMLTAYNILPAQTTAEIANRFYHKVQNTPVVGKTPLKQAPPATQTDPVAKPAPLENPQKIKSAAQRRLPLQPVQNL